MARIKKQKSRKQQVADLAVDYLKLKTVSKTAKGAGKAAKGTAVYKTASKTPGVKRIPVLIAGAGAAVVAIVFLKGRGDDSTATA